MTLRSSAVSRPGIWLAGGTVFLSFLCGLFAPELRAQGGLPELVQRLEIPRTKNGVDLPALFERVARVLGERAYPAAPTQKELTHAAVRGLLKMLDDPYTRFLDERAYTDLRQENRGAFEDVGLVLEPQRGPGGSLPIRSAQPGTPASKAGIHRGDRLTRVDGRSVAGMSLSQVIHALRGPSGTRVRLTLTHAGVARQRELSLVRAPVEYEVLSYNLIEGGVGYVSLSEFNDVADGKLERALREMERKGMRGLVLDLRGNPGGMFEAAIDIASRFVPAGGKIVTVRGARGETEERTSNPGRQLVRNFPVVVLVNRMSASASEIVAGAIKDNRAGVIMGTRTFGKGLIQTAFPLSNGCGLLVTSAKYVTPAGTDINRSPTHRGGVMPDIEVELRAEEFARGEDAQLGRAVRYLYGRIGYHKGSQTARHRG